MSTELAYGLTKTLSISMHDAEARVRDALKQEGFGVLTRIDVAGTFREKLDIGFRPYCILGACNPLLAHRALTKELDIGLLLPCNVVVYEGEAAESAVVSILDPVRQLGVAGRPDMEPLALEVRSRMERVLDAL